MNKKNIQISFLNETDIDEINDFYFSIYNKPRSKGQFLWEFFKAPAGEAIYVVAKDSDSLKIVGTQCAIPIELIDQNGTVFLTAKSEDTLVHPEYRGLNIFENMYNLLLDECKARGIKYIWGFTTAKKPFLKIGFTIPFDQSQSMMVLNVIKSYRYISSLNSENNFLTKAKIFLACFGSKVISFKRHLFYFKQQFDYSISNSSIEFDRDKIKSSSKGFLIKQDSSYLKWRVIDNTYYKKIFNIYFSKNGKVLANIIFNQHKEGIWYLVNTIFSNEIPEKEKIQLQNMAVHLLVKSEKGLVSLIRTWEFTHNNDGRDEIEIRKKVGFFYIKRGLSFVWKNLDDSNELDAKDFTLSRIATQGNI